MAVITVFGSGIMATVLATPLTDNGHEVRLVDIYLDRETITSIQEAGIHPNLDLKVPDGMTAHQLEDALRAFEGAEFVMSGASSFGVNQVSDQSASLLHSGMYIITLAEGMQADDDGNLTILPRALTSHLPEELRSRVSVSVIAGPSIAGEVAMYRHTSAVFTGEDPRVLTRWRGLFATEHYRVWVNIDFVGIEVCAATKSYYAFGADFVQGLLDAMGETAGDRYVNCNYGAVLFEQASVEMTRSMELLGGKPITPIGLPGIGDCFVTSMSGRSMRYGRLIGSGMILSQARAQMPGAILEDAAAIAAIGGAMIHLTERGTVSPERFPLLRRLYGVVGLDQPVAISWDSLFGGNGSGQVWPNTHPNDERAKKSR